MVALTKTVKNVFFEAVGRYIRKQNDKGDGVPATNGKWFYE